MEMLPQGCLKRYPTNNYMNNLPPLPAVHKLPFLILFLFLASCSGTKNLAGGPRKEASESLWRQIEARQLRANWFEGTARISYDDGNQALKVSATLRMQQDSAVWVAVRKLGFEVARALVTPDSIFLIDRFNNEFHAYSLVQISSQYHLPPDLRLIQHLILGNPVFLANRPEFIQTEGPALTLQEANPIGTLQYRLQTDDFRPRSIEFRSNQGPQEMFMTLDDYNATPDKQKFSYLRLLTLNGQETGKINVELKFSEVELNVPKSLPFEIPGRYLRVP